MFSLLPKSFIIGVTLAVGALLAIERLSPITPHERSLPIVPLEINNDLLPAEHLFEGIIRAPEHIAPARDGSLTAGLIDGSIVSISRDGSSYRVIGHVGEKSDECGQKKNMHRCGRPLGLTHAPARFFRKYLLEKISDDDEVLIICDAVKGLLLMDADGNVQVLLNQVKGRKMLLANSVVVSKEGIVYMTEMSTRYGLEDLGMEVFEAIPSGTLLAFDPQTGIVDEMLTSHDTANGIAFASSDEDAVIVNSVSANTINKFYLKGPKKNTLEKFLDTPGCPDNIMRVTVSAWKKEVFLVGFPLIPDSMLRFVMESPMMRKFLAMLPTDLVEQAATSPTGIAVIDNNGKLIRVFQDNTGKTKDITCAYATEEYLYFGSFKRDFLGRIALKHLSIE